ncbi:MAG: metallophosphoesterase [Actinomycetota bacterium]|nr:metallophosphoesterase [Actinomycetota bacterium]
MISVVVITAGAIAFIEYRRQIISYLTHWKGGPSSTEPYLPFPEQPNFHIAAAGDTGDAGSRLDSTGVAIERIGEQYPFDALLLLGDLVYPSGDPSKLQSLVDEPFAGVLDQGAELLAILGNHDVKSDQGDQIMHDLGMPGRYWARTFGEVLVVGLDSTEMDDAAQLTFLESTLANSEANWKIVALHHPPYSAGYQGSSKDARRTFSPIFERYGVQLVLSGHDHDYQRSEPINGVTYVVSGAGSGTRRTGEDDFTAVAYSFIHFTDVAVFDDQLVIRAVDTAGRVADEATIMLGSVPSD